MDSNLVEFIKKGPEHPFQREQEPTDLEERN